MGILPAPVMSGIGRARNRMMGNVLRLVLCAGIFAAAPAPLLAQGAPDESSAGAATLFATSCGWCHSEGGREAGKGPKLAGTQRSDPFIVDRIKHGKPGQMPGFAASLNDEQIAALVGYIRSLPSE
jgi:mono/diheme cytochrome c family protein